MATRSIYVVDGDDAVRGSLISLLSLRPSLLVHGFRSGDAFLDQAAELPPGVLLLDHHPPGSLGIEVLQASRRYPGRFVVVILTGEGNIDLAVQAMKSGAFDFLEKPYDPEALLATVDSAFARLEQDAILTDRTQAAERKIANLSPRETDVLHGLINGRPNKIIAHELSISPRTVEIYRANMMEKLGVRSLSEALRIAFAAGLGDARIE